MILFLVVFGLLLTSVVFANRELFAGALKNSTWWQFLLFVLALGLMVWLELQVV
jgi:uncharacterized membrane protein YbhN (UPF0104 family)